MQIDEAARIFGWILDPPQAYLVVTAIMLLTLKSQGFKAGITFSIAALSGHLLIGTLKRFFSVPRPCFGQDFCPEGFDFPSGHSNMGMIIGIGILIFFGRKRKSVILLAAIFLLQGPSRILAGVHTKEAVIAGCSIGTLIALTIWVINKGSIRGKET